MEHATKKTGNPPWGTTWESFCEWAEAKYGVELRDNSFAKDALIERINSGRDFVSANTPLTPPQNSP